MPKFPFPSQKYTVNKKIPLFSAPLQRGNKKKRNANFLTKHFESEKNIEKKYPREKKSGLRWKSDSPVFSYKLSATSGSQKNIRRSVTQEKISRQPAASLSSTKFPYTQSLCSPAQKKNSPAQKRKIGKVPKELSRFIQTFIQSKPQEKSEILCRARPAILSFCIPQTVAPR